jgi:nucleoside-diphosphate-sugar epimerase
VRYYSELKAACAGEVQSALPGRTLVVRPGLIVGPHDPTERFTYWLRRLAGGGRVLAPDAPDQPVQLIDARDLAEWIVRMVEDGAAGVYNATGPATPLTFGAMLERIRSAADPTPAAPVARPSSSGSTRPAWPRRASSPGKSCRCGWTCHVSRISAASSPSTSGARWPPA